MEKPSFKVTRGTEQLHKAGTLKGGEKGSTQQLRVNLENIVKQGVLFQRTILLKRYKKQYMFYLEKRDEITGAGPFLKYGRVGKPVSAVIDLSLKPATALEGVSSTHVFKDQGKSRTKFKLITEEVSLSLKAESPEERDSWIHALIHETQAMISHVNDELEGGTHDANGAGAQDSYRTVSLQKIQEFQMPERTAAPTTIRQITELLQRYEEKLTAKIDNSQQAYEKFSNDLVVVESELEKKQKDKFGRMKASAQEFIANQKEAMEMIAEVTKGVYILLEKMAEKEIERDPVEFIRNETLQAEEMQPGFRDKMSAMELKFSDSDEEFKDAQDGRIYNPELIEELDEVFHDAHDHFMQRKSTRKTARLDQLEKADDPWGYEPREQLPFFKDPKVKISLWTVIKDSIGKDLSKITVPVYFNQPLSLLQQFACPTEHSFILDRAVKEADPIKRMAFIGVFLAIQQTHIEKFPSKPFNPMLGETFEFRKPGEYKYLAEQVSHHPPITAYLLLGDSGYTREFNFLSKMKFSKGNMTLTNPYKEYIEMRPHGERFMLEQPLLSVHNMIIGTPYLDAGGKGYIRNMACPNERYVEIEFHRRGWSQSSYFKLNGSVFSAPGQVEYRIEGRWNEYVNLTNVRTGETEKVWTKKPYPEECDHMYGMSHHQLQLNYLPAEIVPYLPPTDTRFRPDQRALENGDFKKAEIEKNRLEERQRAVRRYNEKFGIHPKPFYFEEWQNPDDPSRTYYKYNGLYFEKDSKEKNWARLPEIFSETLPPEIDEFNKSTQKKK